jgi:nucleoside phosphorylase
MKLLKTVLLIAIIGALFINADALKHRRRPPRVGLLFALSFEADPFITKLGLTAVNKTNGLLHNPLLPTRVYEGVHNNVHYKAVYAGVDRFSAPNRVQNIGPENAILSTLVLLNQFKADLIVSAGIAGGYSTRFHTGEIGVCANNETTPYYDRRTAFGLPGYGDYGYGEYNCAEIPQSLLTANNLKLARVATGSSYEPTPSDTPFLVGTNVDIVEMESAAEAYLAQVLEIPFLAFKIVSNSYAYPADPVIPFPTLTNSLADAAINVIEDLDFPLQDD